MEKSGIGAYDPNSERPKEFLGDWSRSEETLLTAETQLVAKFKEQILSSIMNQSSAEEKQLIKTSTDIHEQKYDFMGEPMVTHEETSHGKAIRLARAELLDDGYSKEQIDNAVGSLFELEQGSNYHF